MAYDVARVRGLIPSLGDGWIHLDPQAGMQHPDSVSTAVSTAFRGSAASHTGRHVSSRRSAATLEAAREAVADLVGGDPAGVVLGQDRAVLLAWLAEALSSRLGLGTGVVLSRLDEEANVAPWLRVANRYGAQVRWAEVEIDTCDLPSWQFAELIGATTRLVALTAASPIVGSAPDVRVAADRIHEVGGLLVADAIAAAPYAHVDIHEMGADVLAVNAPSWGGPQIGALIFREPALLDKIPAISLNPYATGPERLEMGGHQYALLAGLTASIDYLAGLDETARGSRRERLETSISSLQDYHDRIFDYLMASLRRLPQVMLIGTSHSRVPTISFTVAGVPAEKVSLHFAERRIGTLVGERGGSRLLDSLGVSDEGGAVTIGLAPYTTRYEIDQLVRAVAALG
ncbi:cysteine desulfurase family protein (TIGR01976 family) [Rhodococcus sp. PvR044]|jgi:cysteine desulfurase family protein (TIGR01976 family)|uniref:cysteine desulfurase-like protein n=1 Tax=Rhodococcus TaxID=1827 RepID=UPI000BC90310|nr:MULTISPECIES: cysteine desulfurase-like protein [Rhodococcus]MBP1161174.1 cysteine desulfurase [Rhodococcus sp. PvR099]MCZ4557635.1 cysteine desulfurase-like protein [Rhodococcus maanshanensis]PTR39568.1 cysteine desulfurase [Rhodococcus sp. OK611]SNX92719.1 cysteine desulfurase [Rhodococcus sp. OK270]